MNILARGADALILTDADGIILEVSPQAETMFSLSRATLVGRNLSEFVSPPTGQTASAAILASDAGSARRRDGECFEVSIERRSLKIGTAPVLSICLRARAESEKAQSTLLHAQQMEAIGQLSGGVAHDFNNLLTVIIASLDAVYGRLDGDNQVRIGHALAAADSGAALVRQLLAFSRKQVLLPAPCDLADVAQSTAELLRRTLGEQVKISVHCQSGTWQALADARLVESALLNMAVNARDAMPNGGRIHIEVENARLDEAYIANNGDVCAGDDMRPSLSPVRNATSSSGLTPWANSP